MKTSIVSAIALASSLLLVACGAEREEPFNPPEDEDDEIRDPVGVSRIERFEFENINSTPPGSTPLGKRLEVFTDEDDFIERADNYRGSLFVEAPDFTERRAILYDSGWVDTQPCAQWLSLDQVEAFDITEDESVVEVVITYDFQEADEDAQCGEEQYYREVFFYSIATQADIVVVEEVEGANDSASSSSSSASSSSAGSNDS